MPELRELQHSFGAALADVDHSAAALELCLGSSALVLPRLAVYRGNVYGNCLKALSGSYPIVRAIVGEEFFEGMAREYARHCPSTCGDLNEHGSTLAEFVEIFPHAADLPYLADVARMEWLAHRAYYAADGTSFDPACLTRIVAAKQDALRPILAPACALLESRWPLKQIWDVHQDDYSGEFQVDLDDRPDRVLVHRPGWRAQVQSLARGDFRFLEGAAKGETLGQALAAAIGEDAAFDPSNTLAHWVRIGVIVDLAA